MKYQLLVAAMNRNEISLYDEMNLSSDAVIINQSDFHRKEFIEKDGCLLQIYSFDERGVGLSRNTALMRATADIVEFADDDMIFTDTYMADVIKAFNDHPEADAILFSVESLNPKRPLLKIPKFKRINRIEALKYGCARLAVRREKIVYNNITFSLLFGGGAKYGSGEDTIFLQDCLKAGLRIYKSPIKVADVKQDDSTWFKGYTDRYYYDKGALFAAALPKMCRLYALVTAFKTIKNIREFKSKYLLYLKGINDFKAYQKGGKNEI